MRICLTQEQKEILEKSRWLTDRQREIFELFYRRGWKIEDIAAELDYSRSTIIRDLKKIRLVLK